MKSKSLVVSLVTGVIFNGSAVWANGLPALSQGSSNLFSASVEVVAGSTAALVDGVELVVSGIVTSGEFLIVTLKGAAEVGTVSLRIPAAIAGSASLAAGTTVQVVTEVAGQALLASGKLIAFVPNETGKSLLHHSSRSEKQ
jgi:uncharacterized Zn-binding protein involved in type VI secretion